MHRLRLPTIRIKTRDLACRLVSERFRSILRSTALTTSKSDDIRAAPGFWIYILKARLPQGHTLDNIVRRAFDARDGRRTSERT